MNTSETAYSMMRVYNYLIEPEILFVSITDELINKPIPLAVYYPLHKFIAFSAYVTIVSLTRQTLNKDKA